MKISMGKNQGIENFKETVPIEDYDASETTA
jgi:hypothetical protein